MLRQLFRIMVSLSAPANRREMIIDDLDEEWTYRIRPQVGLLQAHLWYVKESISLVLVFQRDRVSGKWRTHTRPRRRTNGSSPMRIDGFGNGWWQDMRQTVRGLLRTPSFSTIAVLTLAVGMGGTVIMFSLVHAAYLRPLPYPNANQLVRIFTAYEHDLNGRNAISPLTWQDAAQRPELLSDTEVWERRSYHLSDARVVLFAGRNTRHRTVVYRRRRHNRRRALCHPFAPSVGAVVRCRLGDPESKHRVG
jgi:hypothetical protein